MSLLVKLALSPLLVAQALATRRRALVLPEAEGPRQGRLGAELAPALRLLVVGDSSAAGVGVGHQDHALAGHLTRSLQRLCGQALEWVLVARSGLTTETLLALLQEQPLLSAREGDVAVVVTGVNDVITQVPSHRAVQQREAL
eukprot:gene40413-53424_t